MTHPLPLRTRICGALKLQPMTCAFLARCLGYSTRHEQRIVWASLWRLELGGLVRARGRPYRYELKTLSTEEKQS